MSCWLAPGSLAAQNASPQLVLCITECYHRHTSRHRATGCWTSTVTSDTLTYKNVILSTARDKYHSQPLFLLPVVSTTARFLPASGEKAASHSFSLYQLSS